MMMIYDNETFHVPLVLSRGGGLCAFRQTRLCHLGEPFLKAKLVSSMMFFIATVASVSIRRVSPFSNPIHPALDSPTFSIAFSNE